VGWDGVGEQEGTGIVHIAPGCGAEDFELARQMKLPAIAPLDENGCYVEGFGVLTGHPAASVDEMVVEDLRAKGLLYHVAPYVHRYPVCWRCQTPLVFRLVDEWYIHMGQLYDTPRSELTAAQKAASLRYQIMDVAEQIRWIPAFGLERELDWLRNMQDWMISKKRYWGLALPIWRCGECGWFDVIGSRDELRRRAVEGWQAFDGHAPHRPHVDAVKIGCQSCGAHVTRVPDVGNVWLDAGIVPYSTLRYPHDRGFWGSWFPAEFITESFPGQFRNWFYSLLAMSTVLERRPPFNTVLGFATLLAEDGQAMHKSWGNAIEFNEAADRLGSDVMRWVYASQRPDQNLLFGYSTGREARRQFLIPLWNVYAFLVQYARLAEPLPHVAWQAVAPGAGETVLDQWILARLRDVIDAVTCCLEDFDAHGATVALSAFVDELSNWYVRRSRRRFWEGRPEAMITLYHVMAVLSRLLAPILPFTAEEMYQNLVRRLDREAPESVHHTAWPRPDPDWRDDRLVADMHLVMRLAGLGRAARGQAGVKLRQPLARAMLALRLPGERERVERLEEHLRDELNVKGLEYVSDESELIRLRLRPVLPALGPRFGPRLEAIRQALEAAPPELARRARAGHSIAVTVDDQPVELAAAEVEVLAEPRAGLAIQGEDGYVVGVTTEVTPELEREGLARDIVRLLQTTRKNAGLEITDRIEVRYEAGARVAEAIEEWRDYVAAETLAVLLECGAAWPDGVAESAVLDGEQVRLAIRTAQPA
jgi:isoleucyl-tRNA synthetase